MALAKGPGEPPQSPVEGGGREGDEEDGEDGEDEPSFDDTKDIEDALGRNLHKYEKY